MFLKKEQDNLIAFLAHMSVLSENATEDQIFKILEQSGDFPTEVYLKFLLQRDIFRHSIPSG